MRGIPLTDYSDPVSRSAIDHRFGDSSGKPLSDDASGRVRALREGARLFARHVLASCPPSWERDEALTAIDNACSWSARSIARNE